MLLSQKRSSSVEITGAERWLYLMEILCINSSYLEVVLVWTQYFQYTLLYKKLRSGLLKQSFLAFCDFEYSKFLDSFLTFFLQ